MFGSRAGSENLPLLLFGSHIDSVLHGGNFDGDVGSMGAIEVMRALDDCRVRTRHRLDTSAGLRATTARSERPTRTSSAGSSKYVRSSSAT
jgi:hypothetical protein